MPETLGTILTAARKNKGWSLRDAERETGIPNAHISQIETGKIRQPHAMTLGHLAAGYGASFQELLEAGGYLDAERERAAMLEEQIRADERREYEDLLGSIYLYIPWRFVTRQLTTPQKELFADAVEAWSARLNEGDPDEEKAIADRWWREGGAQ